MKTGKPGLVRIVSRLYAPEAAAACLRLAGVATGCVRSGANVEVMTSTIPKQIGAVEIEVPYQIRRAPVLRNKDGYMRGYLQYLSFDIPLFFRLLFSRKAAITLVEPPPTTGLVAWAASRLLGTPYAYFAADLWSKAAASFAPKPIVKVLELAEKMVFRGAAGVITVTPEMGETISAFGAKQVAVVPNGVDVDLFTSEGPAFPAEQLVELGIGKDPFFLYTGIASEWQNATIFLEAFRQLRKTCPNLHLVFIGQGSDWPVLEAAAAEPELRGYLHMLGLRAPEEVAQWSRSATAALVSLADEGEYQFAYPTKTLSALACGLPVIYTGPGPARADITENNLGWVCDNDPRLLAEIMGYVYRQRQVVCDPVERQRRRDWVVSNRSLAANGQRIADLLRQWAVG